jgi:hypothetical protein
MKQRLFLWMGILCALATTKANAQVTGCTDPVATNFNATATVNDGSCTYANVSRTPVSKFTPPAVLEENSGLIYWNEKLWTHNDGGNPAALYELDTLGNLIRTITISNATNNDWEDIAQDNDYIYIGDFGNNASGNRTDLKIYRVAKTDVLAGNTVTATTINFSYADQTNFSPTANNATDFDCEAMIVAGGNIYLFTKQWISNQTSLYELPTTPGTYSATKLGTYNVAGLITGADVVADRRMIILSGYTNGTLARFIFMLYDYTGNGFLNANKRKVTITGNGQFEGIAFRNPEYIYISREYFSTTFLGFPIVIAQLVESVNLTTLINPYYLLPISMINLKANLDADKVLLEWDILPSKEFKKGELQRRAGSSRDYKAITSISTAKGQYVDRDLNGSSGDLFYRIKALDIDARETYSGEKRVTIPVSPETILQYSAPYLKVQLPTARKVYTVEVFSLNGARLYESKLTQSQNIDLSSLPGGQYVAVIRADGSVLKQLRLLK